MNNPAKQPAAVGQHAQSPPPKALVFEGKGQGNAHAVETGAGLIWVGCCKSPSLLLKVDSELGKTVPIGFDREGGLHDLAFDGDHLWVAHASGHLSKIKPETCEISSYKISVSSGQQPFLYTLLFDGRDLWCGTYTDPGCAIRIERESGANTEFPMPAAPMWSVRTLVSVNNALWACLYTVPGKIIIIDKRSGEQRIVELGEENILCTSSVFDGSHVWIGLDTMPAKLVRVDAQSLDFNTYCLHPGSSCVRGLAFDGQYLWLGLYTKPGELVRFAPHAEEFHRHIMPDALFNVRDLTLDGNRVWAITQNIRYQPSGLYGLPFEGVGRRPCRIVKLGAHPPVKDLSHTRCEVPTLREAGSLTSQDWYRVRRGEDEIAWGRTHADADLPHVLFSHRSHQEFGFLGREQRKAVCERLLRLSALPCGEQSVPVEKGGGRRLLHLGQLRIVYQVDSGTKQIQVSTIRGGKVLDPENVGPAPL